MDHSCAQIVRLRSNLNGAVSRLGPEACFAPPQCDLTRCNARRDVSRVSCHAVPHRAVPCGTVPYRTVPYARSRSKSSRRVRSGGARERLWPTRAVRTKAEAHITFMDPLEGTLLSASMLFHCVILADLRPPSVGIFGTDVLQTILGVGMGTCITAQFLLRGLGLAPHPLLTS